MHFKGAFRSAVAALLIFGNVGASAADGPDLLPASSAWLLRYDADRCRALREFGTGDDLTTLWLDQSGVEPSYNVTVLGKKAGRGFGRGVTVRFGEEGTSKRSYVRSKTRAGTPAVMLYGVYLTPRLVSDGTDPVPIGPERERAIDKIVLSGGTNTIALATGSIGAILEQMRKCTADLVQEIDAENRIAKAAVPKNNPGTWVTPDDYPSVLIRSDVEGLVRFRLLVNDQGLPAACHIVGSTRSEAFDDVVCSALMQRAKFDPAIGTNGRPAASFYTNSVRFMIP
jgi:hypothetical protein